MRFISLFYIEYFPLYDNEDDDDDIHYMKVSYYITKIHIYYKEDFLLHDFTISRNTVVLLMGILLI